MDQIKDLMVRVRGHEGPAYRHTRCIYNAVCLMLIQGHNACSGANWPEQACVLQAATLLFNLPPKDADMLLAEVNFEPTLRQHVHACILYSRGSSSPMLQKYRREVAPYAPILRAAVQYFA